MWWGSSNCCTATPTTAGTTTCPATIEFDDGGGGAPEQPAPFFFEGSCCLVQVRIAKPSQRANDAFRRKLMGMLPDWMIQRDIKIEPFAESPCAGRHLLRRVQLRLRRPRGRKFKVFTNVHCAMVDPKNFDPDVVRGHRGDSASSRPTASPWPRRSSTSRSPATSWRSACGKSTYARCGIIVNVTPWSRSGAAR